MPFPGFQDYINGLIETMLAAQSQIIGTPPIIFKTTQHLPGNLNWVNVGINVLNPLAPYGSPRACTFNNITAMNMYTDALIRAGTQGIDINFDPMALTAASQYTGSIPTTSWWEGTLQNYDGMFAYAAAKGLRVTLRPKPDNAVIYGNITLASQFNAIYTPLLVAAAERWGSILYSLTLAHEFIGGFSSAVPFTVTVPFANSYLQFASAAIKAVAPSLKLSAAAETQFAADGNFFEMFVGRGPNPLPPGVLDLVGVDLYASQSDITQYDAITLATATQWAIWAATAGLPIRTEEGVRPPWVLAGQIPEEANAILGAGYIAWGNSGANDIWLTVIVPWLSSHDYISFALFDAEILIWYTSDASQSNVITSQYPLNLMAQLGGNTQTAVTFEDLQKGNTGMATYTITNDPTGAFLAFFTNLASFISTNPGTIPTMELSAPGGYPPVGVILPGAASGGNVEDFVLYPSGGGIVAGTAQPAPNAPTITVSSSGGTNNRFVITGDTNGLFVGYFAALTAFINQNWAVPETMELSVPGGAPGTGAGLLATGSEVQDFASTKTYFGQSSAFPIPASAPVITVS